LGRPSRGAQFHTSGVFDSAVITLG
jgi:hypothetical protein